MMQSHRIAVIGTSCAGKTTFAKSLAHQLDVQRIELDAIHWRPNWTPAPVEEFRASVEAAVSADSWILDGNYSAVRDIVWARATALIWLDYPFYIVLYRALCRTIRRVISQEPMWAGNTESFRLAFLSRDSILWWVITTYWRRRREFSVYFQEPQNRHLKVTVFSSPGEAAQFLRGFRG